MPSCYLLLGFATSVVGNAREQGIFEEFSTHLAVIHSSCG
jgi:hypothetical protein